MKYTLIAILAWSTLLLTGGEAPALPQSIKSIIDKTEKDVAKNRLTYDDANKRVFDATEKLLKVELEKLTKGGKLDDAVAVKNYIDNMKQDILSKIDESTKQDSPESKEAKAVLRAMTGKWVLVFSGDTIIDHQIKKDGTVEAANNSYKGSVIVNAGKIIFAMEWHDSSRNFSLETPVTDSMVAHTAFGVGTFKRVK